VHAAGFAAARRCLWFLVTQCVSQFQKVSAWKERFSTDNELRNTTEQCLRQQPETFHFIVINKLKDHHKLYINKSGSLAATFIYLLGL